MSATFLMFHELERPGGTLADEAPGYVRYVVDEARFSRWLRWLSAAGRSGVSVGEWRREPARAGTVVFTFDDGCESDWTVAAPLLREAGFGATFYVVSRWIGRRRGFMTAAQLRSLHEAGFEIGSHSATHAFLSDLEPRALREEIAGSKRELEDLLGAPVRHLSCPGGRWHRRVSEVAREASYETVSTSAIGRNGAGSDAWALARCAVLRDTSDGAFRDLCLGTGFARLRARQQLLDGAKRLLGTRLYTGLRRRALKST